MENEVVIDVQNVEKSFRVYKDKGYTLKSKMLFSNRRAYEERRVLRGISFQVYRGEAIGLIGHNGCGKSTTLKLLTRIIYPDKGKITMKGRVSSLIELGAGFHPDMTGRENIYINASIFGLTREEIDRRLGDIIEFSELGELIDTPVRTYSSGMYMRLAFSVAINVDADILLVDEILAVGDAAFQAKCFNRLKEIKATGTTIVIVSHSLGQIEQICERSLWIHEGQIKAEGRPRDVHPAYMEYMGKKNHPEQEAAEVIIEEDDGEEGQSKQQETQIEEGPKMRWGNRNVYFKRIHLYGENDEEKDVFRTGEPFKIVMEYKVRKPVEDPNCGIGIFRNDGLQCYGTNTQIDYIRDIQLGNSGGRICFQTDNLTLLPGEYTVDVAVQAQDTFAYDFYRNARKFRVYSEYSDVGLSRLEHTWTFLPNETNPTDE